MKIINHILALIVFFSCQRNEYDFEREKVTVNNQQFEILTAYEIFDSFIDKKSNYTRDVFQPIKNEFNHNAEYPFLFESIEKEMKPDRILKEELELLKIIDFGQIVDSAFRIITKELSGPDTKILFIPANTKYRKFYKEWGFGIQAVTIGTGKIIVSIDPTIENFKQIMPYVLAHEYHHSVWTSRNFTTADLTPLEYLLLEGRADSFAEELFPFGNHPFINTLTEDQEKSVWNQIKPELNNRNSKMNDKMAYGSKDIPYGSVYSIGFSIIRSFKKNNPKITDIELIDIPAEQILHLSKYDK